jgi:hypothetical protein
MRNRRAGIVLLATIAGLFAPSIASSQPIFGSPTTPEAQRSAADSVKSQVSWVVNATRTASNRSDAGVGIMWQQFETLRGAFSGFKGTLSPQQLNAGANDIAELEAGLDIIQEAFTNYEADLAAGRPARTALNDLCQVLRQGVQVWLQEFNRDCSRLKVGRYQF